MPRELPDFFSQPRLGPDGSNTGGSDKNFPKVSQISTLQNTLRQNVAASFLQESSRPTRNAILQDEVARAVGKSIAISTNKEGASEKITDVVNQVLSSTVKDFDELPFSLARQRTRTRVLGYIGEIMDLVGLKSVDMAKVLDNVDIRHTINLVKSNVPEAASSQSLSLPEIQKSLKTHVPASDSFWAIINSMQMLPKDAPKFTEKEMKFLEIMIQLGDATYAFSVLNDPSPREGRLFDPSRLQVYPLTIQEFYDQKKKLGIDNATTLTALNLLKDLRTDQGESLSPYLNQDEAGEIKMTMQQIRKQQAFSGEMIDLVGKAITSEYGIPAKGNDIGSWIRGTNNGVHPDVDLAYLNIPLDIQGSRSGYVSWEKIRTYGKNGQVSEGLVNIDEPKTIDEVKAIDPRMARVIQTTMDQFSTIGTNVHFVRLSAWSGGIMFNISLDHPRYAGIEFDVNLVPKDKDFGVNHTQRFNNYLKAVIHSYGEEGGLTLLEDIRRIKRLAKEHSNNGNDKSKKIPGFLIESLFTSQSRPKTYKEVIGQLYSYFPTDNVDRQVRIKNQQTPLVGTFKKHPWRSEVDKLSEIMRSPSFTIGGYQTLMSIVDSEAKRLGITKK